MDPVKVGLRTKIINLHITTSSGVLIDGTRIYPKHISSVADPIYPCITICCTDDGDDNYRIADNCDYQIDVWSKKGNDELWDIFAPIKRDFFVHPRIVGLIYNIKRRRINDDLYDADTMTHHLAAGYKIIAKKQ